MDTNLVMDVGEITYMDTVRVAAKYCPEQHRARFPDLHDTSNRRVGSNERPFSKEIPLE